MNLKIQTQNSLICHSTQVTVEACVHLVLCFMTTIGTLGVRKSMSRKNEYSITFGYELK